MSAPAARWHDDLARTCAAGRPTCDDDGDDGRSELCAFGRRSLAQDTESVSCQAKAGVDVGADRLDALSPRDQAVPAEAPQSIVEFGAVQVETPSVGPSRSKRY